MTKAELVAKLKRELAGNERRARECDNPAGYSGYYWSCQYSRVRLEAAEALPDDWEGDGDAVAKAASDAWSAERVKSAIADAERSRAYWKVRRPYGDY